MHGNNHSPNLVSLIRSQIHIGYLNVFPKYLNFVMFWKDVLAMSISNYIIISSCGNI
jgi:hypothetical protein